MATSTLAEWRDAYDTRSKAVLLFNVLVGIQVIAAVVYGVVFDVTPSRLTIFFLPFLWGATSILAVRWVDVPSRDRRHHLLAGSVAGGYLLLFLYVSGTIGGTPNQFDAVTNSVGLGVETGRTLGWGPVIYYSGEVIGARVIPYQLVGYAALSYLIYAAILDSVRSASAGLVGIALCPACALAVVSPLVASLAGTASAFALFFEYNYEVSTVLFVGAMALLYSRPPLTALRDQFSQQLRPIAAGLAFFVAILHIGHPTHGVAKLLEYVQVGVLYDPRPLAFTLSGIGIVIGVTLAAAGAQRKPLYVLGIGLMLVYILGYGTWHAFLGHGAFWPYIEHTGHTDEWFLETVAVHLFNDGIAFVSKLAEATLVGLLVVLYRRE